MATRKKSVQKKAVQKKRVKAKAPKRLAGKPVKKPAPPGPSREKRPPPSRRRTPPMHARVAHPELRDSEAEHDETFEVFKSFDRDGSGSIDRAELARLLEALGQELSEEELEVALDVVDANHSGRISWAEFQAWWSAR